MNYEHNDKLMAEDDLRKQMTPPPPAPQQPMDPKVPPSRSVGGWLAMELPDEPKQPAQAGEDSKYPDLKPEDKLYVVAEAYDDTPVLVECMKEAADEIISLRSKLEQSERAIREEILPHVRLSHGVPRVYFAGMDVTRTLAAFNIETTPPEGSAST